MTASPTILLVVLAFLLVLVSIGLWARAGSRTVAGYYVADKKLPSWVIAFSSNATGESAWLLLGLTGMGYAVGIHAFWVVLGEVVGVTLGWVLVARRFKAFTDRYDAITVPDYLEDRFRDTRHVLRLMSAVIIFSMVAAYTAAQFTAAGKAFGSFLGLDYGAGVLIGAAIVLYYTTVGGFKAVAYTDFVQGLLMFGGLLMLPLVAIPAAGGWDAMIAALGAADPNLLRPMGAHGVSLAGIVSAASFVAVGLAFLGAPQLLTRFMAARDQTEIVRGGALAVVCIVVFDAGAVLAGMAGRVLFPALPDPETVMPTLSGALFADVFTGLFLVVVLAAILSTVDSLLILVSSAVARDVIQKVYRPMVSDERVALYGKLITVAIGGIALVFALAETRAIFWFVLFAWSGLAGAFAPVVLCSLFWARTTRAGAIAGMAGGFLATVIWVLAFKSSFYELYEMIPGFAIGFALTIGVSLLTQPPAGVHEEMDAVRRMLDQPALDAVPAAAAELVAPHG